MGPPLVTRQVSNLLVVHFIGRLSLETKPRPRSWPTLSIVWCQVYCMAVDRAISGVLQLCSVQCGRRRRLLAARLLHWTLSVGLLHALSMVLGYRFIADIFLKICWPFWCKICGKNMRNLAKYAAYMLHICSITEICGVSNACTCVYVGQNAQKCWKMRSHMRKYAIICEFLQIYA